MMADEWRGCSGGHGGLPTLGLVTCSKTQGVLLRERGSPVEGIEGIPYGKIRSQSSPHGRLESRPRVTVAAENRAASICWRWGEVPRGLS